MAVELYFHVLSGTNNSFLYIIFVLCPTLFKSGIHLYPLSLIVRHLIPFNSVYLFSYLLPNIRLFGV